MKKILITGGLGQVGSHIVDLLMEREVEIVVIDNLATGRKENLEEKKNLKILFCDVSDKKKIIVIDDLKSNISEWNSSGGVGIHHKNANSTIAQLKELGM